VRFLTLRTTIYMEFRTHYRCSDRLARSVSSSSFTACTFLSATVNGSFFGGTLGVGSALLKQEMITCMRSITRGPPRRVKVREAKLFKNMSIIIT
jgi:hypothetical protein